jgi:hypothetical protein
VSGSNITQAYSGSFTITSATGGGGTNYLSGSFSDSVFGSGTGLTLTASSATPGESVLFNSGPGGVTTLGAPRAISLAFADVTPPASVVNGTLDSFTSSVAGTFSAVPEPSAVVLLGIAIPLVGGAMARRRNRSV